MRSTITVEDNFVRAELKGRETAAETRAFLHEVADAAEAAGQARVLISVIDSKPLFAVEKFGVSSYFAMLRSRVGSRVAVIGDTDELRAAHEYLELLAVQHGVNLRSFQSERVALKWLLSEQQLPAPAG